MTCALQAYIALLAYIIIAIFSLVKTYIKTIAYYTLAIVKKALFMIDKIIRGN